MLISGIHTCEYCNTDIEWEYLVLQTIKSGTTIEFNRIDPKKVRPHIVDEFQDNKYLFRVRCKECGSLNEFVFQSEISL